jgi:hypothetical protein
MWLMLNPDRLSRTLPQMMALLAITLVWTLLIPGAVAYGEGVFYSVEIPSAAVEQREQLTRYSDQRATFEGLRAQVDGRLHLAANGKVEDDIERLLSVHDHIQRELNGLSNPISLLPFYGNPSWCFWASAYFGLSALGLFLARRPARWFTPRSIAAAAAAYFMFSSTSWLRNFGLGSKGRTIFSYVNYDIGRWSFVLQEIRGLGICILLVVAWRAWSEHYASVVTDINNWDRPTEALDDVAQRASRIRNLFFEWKLASVCVVMAFLPWTYFYWQTATIFGDSRYWVSAIVMHSFWAVTWIGVSAPLLAASRWWTGLRARIVASSGGNDVTLKALKELDPIGNAGAFGAAIASVVSFLLPVVEFVKKVI